MRCTPLMIAALLVTLSSTAAAEETRDGVAPLVGLYFGPAFSLSPLQTAVFPRLEAGVELPFLARRLRVAAMVAYLRPVASGEADDSRVPDGDWSWELQQSEWQLGLGLTVRLPEAGRIVPEITVGPQVVFLKSRVDGEAAGAAFGEVEEVYSRLGVYASLGAALALGPGELSVSVALSTAKLVGAATGDSTTAAVVPLVGYRLVL